MTLQSREVAPEIQAVLTRAGGLNPFGKARFRAVWGWNRLTWIGGQWVNYDEHGNYTGTSIEERNVPKYDPPDRWYIEKWCPPELYGSREVWERTTIEEPEKGILIPALGPYPSEGEYELSWRCEISATHEPIELTVGIAEEYVKRLLRSEQFSLFQRLSALKAREEKEEKEADARRHSIFRNRDLLYTNPDSGKKSYATQLDNKPAFEKEKPLVIAP